ncbi:aminotransferase class I/II-fold pyridoxal phosphate-dependent enzyme [Candidatus Kaiserbacteria bacterium]|nr:aminotransferase class I/II-fold pyridoxal phosphate-dependent enzyme [Candidatus Kaiserbacteria bacterium]
MNPIRNSSPQPSGRASAGAISNGVKVAARIEKIPEYIFSRLNKEVAAIEKDVGRKVLNLGPGSPDFPPSEIYVQKFFEFVRHPQAHLYPGYRGVQEFNDAVRAFYKRRFDVDLEDNEVLPLLGGKDGISHLPLALADAGDNVLAPNPGYPPFSEPGPLFGVSSNYYDLLPENGFKPDLAALGTQINDKTRYMWINFPGNPTGAVATHDELKTYAHFAKKHGIAVVHDNAYAEITFDGYVAPSILQIPGAKEYAAEIGSFSKTFSFAGLRMGWLVGNRNIIASLQKVKSQMDSGMALPLQLLGAFALQNRDEKWHEAMLASYRSRRDIIAEKLKGLGLTFSLPRGSLYIWAKIPDAAKDSESFCKDLLREKQVMLTPGIAYCSNGDRYIRASICANVDKINEYL